MKYRYTEEQLRMLEKGNIHCRDFEAMLCDYSEGELPPTLKARLEQHLNHCEVCKENLHSYLWLVQLAAELRDRPLPKDVQTRLRLNLNRKLGLNLSTTA